MKLKYQFVINQMADQFIAVPIGNQIVDFNGVIKLNETAAFIIEQLSDEISYNELVSAISEKFNCDLNSAKENADSVINGLRGNGLITE